MATETKPELADSEEEDVYEVERIIDMRVEEGEVLYRVRWKNYCSDDDTWEPEAHLEDCHEVLLAFKKTTSELKAKKEEDEPAEPVPVKPAVKIEAFDADSESDSDKDRPTEAPVKKKKKKKKHKEEEVVQLPKEKEKKKKKDKMKEDIKPVPAPETDDDELRPLTPPSPPKEKPRSKLKRGKWEVKLHGLKDLTQEKKMKRVDSQQKESSLLKLKNLTSKAKEATPHSSDSSDSATLFKKNKSKAPETSPAPPKAPTSSTSSSPSSTGVTPSSNKAKEEAVAKEDVSTAKDKDKGSSPNLFEKFLLNCEAKDRAPRRPPVHQPIAEKSSSKPTKVTGKIEKVQKPSKESPVQKPEPEKTKHEVPPKSSQGHGFSLDSDDMETQESTSKMRPGEDFGERREEPRRLSSEKRMPADEKKKRREGPLMASEDNQDIHDPLEIIDKSDKGPSTLNLGMDLNLDWMSLDDFQKHLNGEDEILTGPPLSPSELRDAVKSGDYMAVKLALNSRTEYNLDQEDVSGMSLTMLAAAGGQDDILRLLIRKGVRVNGRQKNGTTALMHAAEKNFLTTVAILLEAGSFVNAQTLSGETALMKACKRGNADIVRLLLDYGADCNIQSKHKNTAISFAKLSNNLTVRHLIEERINILSSVAEDTIRAYFESRLGILEPVFPLACHRLCEGPDFSMEFGFKAQPQQEGSGIILFIFHANFLNDITARLCGPCSVHAVVLNDKFQLPIFLDSHFIYSFSPVIGINKLFIRFADAPAAKVKLLICAYRVQLQ
ncbi:M-phase phosphoprotein 8 [Neosynchiropus ocellatus]